MKKQKTTTNLRRSAACIVAFSFFISGCTSLQQSTAVVADDLYDNPSPKQIQSSVAVAQDDAENYQDYQNYQDDRYLRLKVANRNRWSSIDDFGYWNDPRYNNAYYPSYMGWNSWYAGYYGASWYNPFGVYSMGWGGYYPYMNSYYSLGWGFNDFGFGYGGYGGFGYAGLGFGYGYGWNPYYSYYGIGGYYGGGYPLHGGQYYQRVPVQPNRTNLAAYNNRGTRNFNSNEGIRPSSVGNFAGSRNINSATINNNNNSFGSLVRRAISSNSMNGSSDLNSLERPSRFSNNSIHSNRTNSNGNYVAPRVSNNISSPSNFSSGGSSGGFRSSGGAGGGGFVGGGRRGGGK